MALYWWRLTLSKREMRNLLIGAMFHDFDHRGTTGPDILNIELAVKGLRKHILPEDKAHINDIISIIKETEYPYKRNSANLSLCIQIIRDADLSQSLCTVWLQQVIFGLSAEWNKTPLEVLKSQVAFHESIKLSTTWANETWPIDEINKKIDEAKSLIDILDVENDL